MSLQVLRRHSRQVTLTEVSWEPCCYLMCNENHEPDITKQPGLVKFDTPLEVCLSL